MSNENTTNSDERQAAIRARQAQFQKGHYEGLRDRSVRVESDVAHSSDCPVVNEFLGEGPHKPTCFGAALVAIDKTCG